MTRRKTTTIIHTPRRPVDKAQSVEQAIGPVSPLAPDLHVEQVVSAVGVDDSACPVELGLGVTA